MPSLNIAVFPDHDEFVRRLIESGRYDSASDVVHHALSLLEDREAARDEKLARLNASIEEGLADIEAGRTVPAEEVFAELYRMIEEDNRQPDAAE